MEFRNISEFRAQAEKCFLRSQLTDDRTVKLHWLSLAEAWLLMSENMRNQDFNEMFGVTAELYAMPRQHMRH